MSKNIEFENKAKAYLDESLNELSPDITRRLQQARNAALEKAKPRSLWSFFPQAATAAFAIVVVSLSFNFNFNFNQNETTDTVIAMETEMEMLTSNDNLELMEDLEFIQWLVESEQYAG